MFGLLPQLAPPIRAQAQAQSEKPVFRGGDPRLTEAAIEEMVQAWGFCEGQALAAKKLQAECSDLTNRFELAQRSVRSSSARLATTSNS